MKKRLLGISIMLLFLLGNASAILPYKESLDIKDLRISKVQCSDNKLNILVENKETGNAKILFKVYSSKGNINVFSNELLKRLEARYTLINTDLPCKDLLRLEINGYVDLGNEEKIVYLNSEPSYQFTGNEESISAEIAQPIQEATEATQSAQQSSRNSYIYFGSRLIASFDSSNAPLYYSQDNIGSNVILTDDGGNLISRQQFEPFGNEIKLSSINSGSKFKFTGKELDSSSLYYYGARYYSADTGRFISVDPIFNPSESSYAYVNNNPINKVDPDGKAAFLAPLIAGAIAAAPAVARWAQGIATDPSNMVDMQDLREGWNNKNYWIAGFALLGLASAGSSGRGAREVSEFGVESIQTGKVAISRFLVKEKVRGPETVVNMKRAINEVQAKIKSGANNLDVKVSSDENAKEILERLNIKIKKDPLPHMPPPKSPAEYTNINPGEALYQPATLNFDSIGRQIQIVPAHPDYSSLHTHYTHYNAITPEGHKVTVIIVPPK